MCPGNLFQSVKITRFLKFTASTFLILPFHLTAQPPDILPSVNNSINAMKVVFLEQSSKDGSVIASALNRLPWQQTGIFQAPSSAIVELTLKINGLKSGEKLKTETERLQVLGRISKILDADVLIFVDKKIWVMDKFSRGNLQEFAPYPISGENGAQFPNAVAWLSKILGFNAVVLSTNEGIIYAKSLLPVTPGQQGVVYLSSERQQSLFNPGTEKIQAVIEATNAAQSGIFPLRVLLSGASPVILKKGARISLLAP